MTGILAIIGLLVLIWFLFKVLKGASMFFEVVSTFFTWAADTLRSETSKNRITKSCSKKIESEDDYIRQVRKEIDEITRGFKN